MEWIDLPAIQQWQNLRKRRKAVVDALRQLGVDVQIGYIGLPSGERLALEPQNYARLVREVRQVPVAGEHGPVADQQVRRGAAGLCHHESGRIEGTCVRAARPLKQKCRKTKTKGRIKIRRLAGQGVAGRQDELVGKRHRLDDGPLLLARVRELAVTLQITCKCVTQGAEYARLLLLGKQRHQRRRIETAHVS